jgi:hypothetical protein
VNVAPVMWAGMLCIVRSMQALGACTCAAVPEVVNRRLRHYTVVVALLLLLKRVTSCCECVQVVMPVSPAESIMYSLQFLTCRTSPAHTCACKERRLWPSRENAACVWPCVTFQARPKGAQLQRSAHESLRCLVWHAAAAQIEVHVTLSAAAIPQHLTKCTHPLCIRIEHNQGRAVRGVWSSLKLRCIPVKLVIVTLLHPLHGC